MTGVNSSCRRCWRKALHSPNWYSKGGFLRGNYNNGFKKEEVRSELRLNPLRVRSAGAKRSTLFLWWNTWEGTRTGCAWVKGESNRALEPGKHTVAASPRPLQSLQHCDKGFPPSSPKPAKPFLQSQTKQWSGWSPAHKAGVLSCVQSHSKYCQPQQGCHPLPTLPGHSSWKRLETPSPHPFLPQSLLFFFSPEHSPNFPASLDWHLGYANTGLSVTSAPCTSPTALIPPVK